MSILFNDSLLTYQPQLLGLNIEWMGSLTTDMESSPEASMNFWDYFELDVSQGSYEVSLYAISRSNLSMCSTTLPLLQMIEAYFI